MEKRISFFEFQSVKAVARAIDPHQKTLATLSKKQTALKEEYDEKLAKLQQEYQSKLGKIIEDYNACKIQIDALEAGILQVTGFHVSDLVKKVIEPTGKTDKEGKPLKETKYLPTDIVSYDDAAKQYVIKVGEDNTVSVETPTVTEAPVEATEVIPEAPTATEELPFEAPEEKKEEENIFAF